MTVGGVRESSGEWAFVWRASSELHFQLIGLWGAAAGGWRPGGSLLLPLTQSRDSMVRETEVD